MSETAALLADLKARLGLDGEAGARVLRRGLAWLAVAVIHCLFILLLILSQWFPVPVVLQRIRPPMTWVLLTQLGEIRKEVPQKSQKERPSTAVPTAVPPPIVQRKEEENNAIDWGLAIGRSLACGANMYEYLSPLQRAACLHQPWNFVYDRYGNIVLDAGVRPIQQEEKLRTSDIQARERSTAPQCPKNIDPNAPCLSAVIGSHP